MKLPKQRQYFDDERSIGKGALVTLSWRWSFLHGKHQGVMGFDTVTVARSASTYKNIFPCHCAKGQSETLQKEFRKEKITIIEDLFHSDLEELLKQR